jgi:hypothetical protein
MRVLISGWFSFRHGEATAGDLLALDVVREWLDEADVPYEVACSPVLAGGVDLEQVEPGRYSDVVFVCGPARGQQLDDLRARFRHARLIYIDVSMERVEDSCADILFERDSDRLVRPDLSIASSTTAAPFVPVVRSHPQAEYGDRDGHRIAHQMIDRLLERHRLATIEVDTRVDPRRTGSRHSSQVEGLLARADAVITSRLHGLVLAMKHGVPALAIDPVSGGGKVSAQARALDWPEVHTLERTSDGALDASLARCLDASSRDLAVDCRGRAVEQLDVVRDQFLGAFVNGAAKAAS